MPRRAALGIRAHSGWAAVIVVAGDLAMPQIIVRERIAVVDSGEPGAKQPYHFAKALTLRDAEAYIANCASTARRLAAEGLTALRDRMSGSGYTLTGCGVLTASGRAVPGLAEILRSHPMIHTAEGEFFRNAFTEACADLGLQVERFRERDLLEIASTELRLPPAKLKRRLTAMGRTIGSPWAQDQKSAALAALLLLRRRSA